MNEKYTIYQVLKMLDKYIFFSKEKNEEAIYYTKKENSIMCFNSHFKSIITEADFTENFFDVVFYRYIEKAQNNEEENTQYFRQ